MFLDIGLGILAALLVSTFNSINVDWMFVGYGITFALLPDADFLLQSLVKRSFRGAFLRHREIFHYPLLYIPVGTFILSFLSFPLVELFALASFLHFLHDSIGIGWGVQWLYPFTKNHYSFFYIYKPVFRAKKLPRKLFYVWEHDSIEKLDEEFGDPNWVQNIYFALHPYGMIEIAVFVVSIIVLISFIAG